MPALCERFSVRSHSVRSLKKNNAGTDGELGCSPVHPFIPKQPGMNRERTGTDGTEQTDSSPFRGANALARTPSRNPQTGAGPGAIPSFAGTKARHMKTTTAPLTYAPMLLAMRATAYGAALAGLYPDRPRPTLEQLAAMAEAHQARMARAAAELQATPAAAAAKRAEQLRRAEAIARTF